MALGDGVPAGLGLEMLVDAKKKPSSKSGLKNVILVVCIVGGGIWLWEEVIEDRVIPKRWGTVKEGSIYRSGQLSSALVERTLRNHGIEVIVDLTHELPDDRNQQAELRAAEKLGIQHVRFPLRGDGTGDITNYARAIAAVVEAERAGRRVLLHCAAGVQRTGGVLACYRLLVEGQSPKPVVKELMGHKWDPKDNPALLEYVNENLGRLAVLLQEMGVIDSIPDPLPVLRVPD